MNTTSAARFGAALPVIAGIAASFALAAPVSAQTACRTGAYTVGEVKAIRDFSCVSEDKIYSGFSFLSGMLDTDTFSITAFNSPTQESHTVNWSRPGSGFAPNVGPGGLPYGATYTTTVTAGSPKFITGYSTDGQTSIAGAVWSKSLAAPGTSNPGPAVQTNGGGVVTIVPISPVKTVTFNSSWTVSNEILFNVSDTLYQVLPTNQVPGPLPILGAATAFGFSRRLRRRIQRAA